MLPRRLLWLALSIALLPLVLEATGGCSFTPPRDGIVSTVSDNAYECACSCELGQGAASAVIAASSDDAEEEGGGGMDLGNGDLDLGQRLVGLRFLPAIPPGATISEAFVQFTASANDGNASALTIVGELSIDAATFANTNGNLSGRTATLNAVAWSPAAWTNGSAGAEQATPSLGALLQELVSQPGWTTASAVVLRIEGSGQRQAVAFDQRPGQAAVLHVVFDSPGAVTTTLPVCAAEGIARDASGRIDPAAAEADCSGRVATTFSGLTNACQYPTPCSCQLVIPSQGDATFDSASCDDPCVGNPVDPLCEDFDPSAFDDCISGDCTRFISATHAGNDVPVCLAGGEEPEAIAYRMFGRRSTCEVEGTTEVEVGDREPKQDPATDGTIDILGGPCPGGGCAIDASFRLAMEPITFSVRFASDPTFDDLSGLGTSRQPATLNGVEAVFAEDQIEGTGNGRRGADGLAVNALNQAPLVLGVDWSAHACDLNGNLASTVDGEVPDGVCEGDGATLCTADSPDCDAVGGPCVFEAEDIEPMTVNVALAGALVNQPPAAAAGADQTVECTGPNGTAFVLDGSGSGDPDRDIAQASWRRGGRLGAELGRSLSLVDSLGAGATQRYVLQIIDSFAQADEDDTQVAVVDTTPPELAFQLSPDLIWPPNDRMIPVVATVEASDVCDASLEIRLVSIESDEPDKGVMDGGFVGDFAFADVGTDDREFALRAERLGKGNGRTYTITFEAEDDAGNVTQARSSVLVPRNKKAYNAIIRP